MSLFGELSAIVLPIFIAAGIGLVWSRMRWPFDSNLVSTLVYKIAVPCLIIAIFAAARFDRAAGDIAGLIVASTVISFATLPLLLYVVL